MVFDPKILSLNNVKKEEQFRGEITKLVKDYKWKLENPAALSIEDPSCVIWVVTEFDAGTQRPYPEIKKFRDELERILQKPEYNLAIEEFYDKNRSIDGKFRRIDISLREEINLQIYWM